ncbi:MAG: hypothetical protein ACFNWZ_00645 [Candidatus Absconditicoccaceae bacterium]
MKLNKKNNSEEIMHRVIQKLSTQPGFPKDYYNIASKALLNALKAEGKEVRLQYSYTEEGKGHRFVVEKREGEETILDPTYLQYDKNYPEGFVGQSFPNPKLEKNRTEEKDFMELQKQRYEEGVYDKFFAKK